MGELHSLHVEEDAILYTPMEYIMLRVHSMGASNVCLMVFMTATAFQEQHVTVVAEQFEKAH